MHVLIDKLIKTSPQRNPLRYKKPRTRPKGIHPRDKKELLKEKFETLLKLELIVKRLHYEGIYSPILSKSNKEIPTLTWKTKTFSFK